MVVDEDDTAGVVDAGLPDDVGGVDDTGTDAATADLDVADDLVANVEQDDVEELLASITQLRRIPVAHVVDGILGTGDALHAACSPFLQALADLNRRLNLHGLGEPDAMHLRDVLDTGLVQFVPAAKPVEHVAAQFLRAPAVTARPEEDGKQPGVAHGVGAVACQLLARTFIDCPVLDGHVGPVVVDAHADLPANGVAGLPGDQTECVCKLGAAGFLDMIARRIAKPGTASGPHGIHGMLD